MPPATAPPGAMTGGRALAEMLRLAGVGPMFGMGGFQLLPFYDALGQLGMRHFLINDERCGAFAADAYARVTNRPGICDGTLGPGATNLVTGLDRGDRTPASRSSPSPATPTAPIPGRT